MKVIQGAQPYFADTIPDILRDIEKVLLSGQLTQGPHLENFEKRFVEVTQSQFALGVSSGGSALELALKALGVQGREVIVPTDTFVASANAVILAGGIPVFADIRKETLCLDPNDVAKKISSKTAGIMLVHMFGLITPDIEELQALCAQHNLFLIEDAAHAHGAFYKGKAAGTLSDVGCFSFYATKVLTTAEGGMVLTQRKDLADKISQLRNHGRHLTEPVYEIPSNNYRLNEIQAILGEYQVGLLEENVRRRNEIAKQYYAALKGVSGLSLLPEFSEGVHSYWRFPIFVSESVDRSKLQKLVSDKHGVRLTWMYEPLCHQQPVFQKYNSEPLPTSEWCLEHLVCLPCYPTLSDEDVKHVIQALISELPNSKG